MPVHIFRLTNVFGKWCRPNYNSAVATFCHNIARGLPIQIHDPAAEQNVSGIAETKGGKVTLEFEKRGDLLVSKTTLPEGDGYNLILQFKPGAAAKPQNFRFQYDAHLCDGCQRAEYACTCEHGDHKEGDGHDHSKDAKKAK